MRQNLIYGKIKLSFEEEGPLSTPITLLDLRPIRMRGKKIDLTFNDKILLNLLKINTPKKLFLEELYQRWSEGYHSVDFSLGEGRSLLEWMKRNQISVRW